MNSLEKFVLAIALGAAGLHTVAVNTESPRPSHPIPAPAARPAACPPEPDWQRYRRGYERRPCQQPRGNP